jgi:acyl carrier protein
MEIKEFIEKFADAIEVDASELSQETEFRQLDSWDSLSYLSVIAMMDEEYDCLIETTDFKNIKTISALVEYIEAHK